MRQDTRSIERDTAHRPWPLPGDPWIMVQSWDDLLFVHWPLPTKMLRPLVPAALAIEEFDGSAWLGQTPFHLTGLRFRWAPPMPGASSFLEMNLRTYVRFRGQPGIFFFSLDAANPLAVRAARAVYRLPYRDAEMSMDRRDGWFRYRSRRVAEHGSVRRPAHAPPAGAGSSAGAAPASAELIARYRPDGEPFLPAPGSLEQFLTERYCFYVVLRSGIILRGDIHHPAWRLQHAAADVERNSVPAAHGLTLPDRTPLLHYSARQPTLIWAPKLIGRAR